MAQDFQTHSSATWPKEGFEDLFRDDFVNAVGWVSRRKLEWLETEPYRCTLLKRGVSKRRDIEDEDRPILTQAMEYAGAVGTMLMDKLAHVHERVEEGIG